MTRLTKYRIGAVSLTVGLWTTVLLAFQSMERPWTGLLILGLLLLVPGRLQGFLWRDFFRGSKLLRANRPTEAVPYLESFIDRLRQRPALRYAMWLQWPGYTPSAMAMALNNLAAAHFNAGAADRAIPLFHEALRVDKAMSLAWWNLAKAYYQQGDRRAAQEASAEAHRLGFKGGTLDALQQCAAGALTRVEGRGV